MEPRELIDFARRAAVAGLERVAETLKYNFFVSNTKKGMSGAHPTKKYLKLNITFVRQDGKKGTLISAIMRELTPDFTRQIALPKGGTTTEFIHDPSQPTKAIMKNAEDALNDGDVLAAPVIKIPMETTPPMPPPPITAPAPPAPAPVVAEPIVPASPYFQKNFPTVINPPQLAFLGPLTLDNVPGFGLVYHDKGITNFTNTWTPEDALKLWPDQF